MKTLLFTIDYPPAFGGVATYYSELVKHWPGPEPLAVLDNTDRRLVNPGLPFFKWRPSFAALKTAVSEQGIEHVIVGQLLPLGTVAWLAAKRLGVGYSVVLHGMELPLALRVARRRFLAKRILDGAGRIICSNSYVAGMAKELVSDPAKVAVVTPGIAAAPPAAPALVQALRDKHGLEGKTVLLTLCRLVKRKGIDRTLEALPQVLAKQPQLAYVIAGGGPDEAYLKGIVGRLPPEQRQRVIFTGPVNDEERWAWFSLCDIFAMPARDIDGDFEGFGIVYLESNLLGKPVIAGRSGGVPDAVVADLNGLLVEPEDTDEIAQAILALSQDRAYAAKLGAQGRERAEKHFAWSDKAEQFHRILENPALKH